LHFGEKISYLCKTRMERFMVSTFNIFQKKSPPRRALLVSIGTCCVHSDIFEL
jgi:hypothetical protein